MMTKKKTKALLIPGYYSSADRECVDTYLAEATALLEQLDVGHTQTSPLGDLDDAAAIQKEAKACEYDVVLLYLISWVDMNVVVDLFNIRGLARCFLGGVGATEPAQRHQQPDEAPGRPPGRDCR